VTDVLFVTETPDSLGGRVKRILDELMDEADLEEEDVGYLSVVRDAPPEGKKVGKRMLAADADWFRAELKKSKAKFIVAFGNSAVQAITGKTGIKSLRGKPIDHRGKVVLPMFSPAMVLHDDRQMPVLRRDFKLLGEMLDFGGIPETKELDFVIVDTEDKFEQMLTEMVGCVSSDLETSRLYPFTTRMDKRIAEGKATPKQLKDHKATHETLDPPRVISIQFGTAKHQWIIPAETAGIWSRSKLEEMVERITEKLEDCFLVGHNWKFDSLWMRVRFGVMWNCDFDTMLAHYLLDENDRHGLKELAQKFCDAVDWDIEGKEKRTWSPKNAKYGAHDTYYTRKLRFIFGKMLRDDPDVERVFFKIMMPCIPMFVEAEYRGIFLDLEKMDDAEKYLREEVAKAEAKLKKWGDINWGAPKQVGNLLYKKLKIKCPEFTKTGAPSTGESALKQIDHECVGDLLAFRGHKQQLSFFIEGWKPYIDEGGRLHPSFKLHGTVTGRLSAEHPNLQQVPRDKRIRTLITAPPGWSLIEMDLSQIELRIAAELADEHNMLEAFNTGVDVHWLTALREIERGAGMKKEIFKTVRLHQEKTRANSLGMEMTYSEAVDYILSIGPDEATELMDLWKETRKKAKAINFGYLYGMWWKKFKIYARDNYGVIVTDKQAQASREAFFTLYPGFTKWHERQRRFARLNGYVRSLSGRKRRLPDAMLYEDTPKRREAERQAINSPVQSFANELNLMAALQIREEFPRKFVHIVGTVHDACLFEVRDDVVPQLYKRGLEIMASPALLKEFEIELSVPIEAEAKIGPWGAGVSLKKWLEAA